MHITGASPSLLCPTKSKLGTSHRNTFWTQTVSGYAMLFIQKCCSHCGLVGKLKTYPKVPLNFVPSIFSCEGYQYIVTAGAQDDRSKLKCPAGLVVRVNNDDTKLDLVYLFRKATDEVKHLSGIVYIRTFQPKLMIYSFTPAAFCLPWKEVMGHS